MPIFPMPYVPKDFKLDSSGHLPSGTGWGKDRGGGYPPHAATDVVAPVGTPILAVDWGTIIEFTRTGFYAGTGSIGIRHPEFVARYAEINPAKGLSEGTLVQQGQIIGQVAQANNEKKTHMLHFEMFADTQSGDLSDTSNKPYERRGDIYDPQPYLMAWAEELKAHKGEIEKLADAAPNKFTWLGPMTNLMSDDAIRNACKNAGFTQKSTSITIIRKPVPEFVFHPRFGKFKNPNLEHTDTDEYWSRPTKDGYAVLRIAHAMGRWATFKEWVLAEHWDAYLKQGTHVHVAVYNDAGDLLTVAAIESL